MNARATRLSVAAALIAASAVAALAAPFWSRRRPGTISTVPVEKGTFVDYLQVRGEIRPVRSTVMTAPAAGSDMQIIELAANGATVAAGDVVVQFDPTVQQRQIEQRRSELKQADAEVQKIETEARRRRQAADAELAQAHSALERARLDVNAAELVPRVEAEKRTLLLANSSLQVKALEAKVEGERIAAAADVAIAVQKRSKAQAVGYTNFREAPAHVQNVVGIRKRVDGAPVRGRRPCLDEGTVVRPDRSETRTEGLADRCEIPASVDRAAVA